MRATALEKSVQASGEGPAPTARPGWQQRWQVPTFLLGVLMLAVALARPLLRGERESKEQVPAGPDLQDAMQALDDGRVEEARLLARRILREGSGGEGSSGGPALVLGLADCLDAEKLDRSSAAPLYTQAAAHLGEASRRGVPEDLTDLMAFYLGKSLYEVGEAAESRPWLRQAAERYPPREVEALHLLAESLLSGDSDQIVEALEVNDGLLRRKLSREDMDRAVYQRGRILLALGRPADAREVLRRISPESSYGKRTTVARSKALVFDEEYGAAIKLLEPLSIDSTLDGTLAAQVDYLLGLSHRALGSTDRALAAFDRVHDDSPVSDEAVAASLEQAEILHSEDRVREALVAYAAALEGINRPEAFRNRWLTLERFRERLGEGWQTLFDDGLFAEALELAAHMEAVVGPTESTHLQARTLERWGRDQLRQAESLGIGPSESLREEAHGHLVQAGEAYRRLADLRRATHHYPDDLWNSAWTLFDGSDYRRAADTFAEFLATNPMGRRTQALVGAGRALMGLDQFAEALKHFEKCRELDPKDPARFTAEYLRGQCYLKLGKLDEAEDAFRGNLEGGLLNPTAVEWRNSLQALGRLLFKTKRYEEAIQKLTEAVARYPHEPQALEGRYLIAEAHRLSADAPLESLKSARSDAAREHYRQELRRQLGSALDGYRALKDDLLAKEMIDGLSPDQEALLRNCFFAEGECLYRMGQFQQAIDAYSAAANRYQQRPEVLDAYVRIANCYRSLGRAAEARNTLEQARLAMDRIPEEAFWSPAASLSRSEWIDWLQWAIQQ